MNFGHSFGDSSNQCSAAIERCSLWESLKKWPKKSERLDLTDVIGYTAKVPGSKENPIVER